MQSRKDGNKRWTTQLEMSYLPDFALLVQQLGECAVFVPLLGVQVAPKFILPATVA